MTLTRSGFRWDPQRRRFLAGAVVAAALPAVSCSNAKSPWRCLTMAEGQALQAICECLIPTDEYPGAAWAGAVKYIDIQLYGHYRKHRSTYRSGVAALDRVSREKYGQPFAALDSERQVELLKAVEKGQGASIGLETGGPAAVLRSGPDPHHAELLWRPAPWRQS